MRWIALAACLLATGCAQRQYPTRAQLDAKTEAMWKQAEEDCGTQQSRQVGGYLQWARCTEPALRNMYEARMMPADLANLLLAQRAVIWSQVDRRQITPEEGDLRYAEARSTVNDRAVRRLSAIMAASPAPYIPPAPVVIQQPAMPLYTAPIQTSCTRIGGTVNCLSN